MPVKAKVTNISRCSLHDGPGIRSVIYLKGCALRCKWCHNPETLIAGSQIAYLPDKCIKCGRCVDICPKHHTVNENDMVFLREGCTSCGKCAEACPTGALSLIGEDRDAESVFEEIKKDVEYYKMSGGGVTFSGGECLLSPDFVAKTAEKCKAEGISTAVESALFVPWENVEKVLPYIDLFLTDLKIPDREKHIRYTGQPNDIIIENLKRLVMTDKQVTVRIPIIPGVNDSQNDLESFAEILNSLEDPRVTVELLKYNYLAGTKYSMIGGKYTSFSEKTQEDKEMSRYCNIISEKTGLKCSF